MRLLAALRRRAPIILAVIAIATFAIGYPAGAIASDPTAAPGGGAGTRVTCAERYPAEGPAGLDLRLGCIIGDVVGQYTASASADATPASRYALFVLAIVVAVVVGAWFVARSLGRAAGRRLAPVRPDEWWLCAACRSVNAAGARHCYSCGAPPPGGPTLPTEEAPSTARSFGSTRKHG